MIPPLKWWRFLFGGKVGNNFGELALIIEELLMIDDSI